MFNLNNIPQDGRTPAQMKAHLDLYNRSQDVCLIHNPDEEDYSFFYNRRFNTQPYIVPGKNKDLGFGKGNLEIRRYLADVYLEKKGEQMINIISKADWEKKKVEYRLEERGQMEERLALRVTNKEIWKKIVPQLFLGVVRRSEEGMGVGQVITEKEVDQTLSSAQQVMEQLGLNDREISLATESQRQELSEEDKKKQELLDSIV